MKNGNKACTLFAHVFACTMAFLMLTTIMMAPTNAEACDSIHPCEKPEIKWVIRGDMGLNGYVALPKEDTTRYYARVTLMMGIHTKIVLCAPINYDGTWDIMMQFHAIYGKLQIVDTPYCFHEMEYHVLDEIEFSP